MLLALACALVANVSAYGFRTILQATGAPERRLRPPRRDVRELRRNSRMSQGSHSDLIGFVASLVALRTLPLCSSYEPRCGSVRITALTAVVIFGFPLRRTGASCHRRARDGTCVAEASARGQQATLLSRLGGWRCCLRESGHRAGRCVVARGPTRRWPRSGRVCRTRVPQAQPSARAVLHIPHDLWRLTAVQCALVLYGASRCSCSPCALQRGSVTATSAVMFSVGTIVPSIVGLAVLGDRTRTHFEIVAAVGFALTVGASLVLARYAEPVKLLERVRTTFLKWFRSSCRCTRRLGGRGGRATPSAMLFGVSSGTSVAFQLGLDAGSLALQKELLRETDVRALVEVVHELVGSAGQRVPAGTVVLSKYGGAIQPRRRSPNSQCGPVPSTTRPTNPLA